MSTNPYQSPRADIAMANVVPGNRERAVVHLRRVFLILLLPAIYNYLCFDAMAIVRSGLPPADRAVYRAVNIFAFLAISVLIWHAGLPLLEGFSGLVRVTFASKTDAAAWNDSLYRAVGVAAPLAIPGAALWAIWVVAFYQLGVAFMTISWLVGIPAHLLGACVYVPLFVRWYRLARAA